MEMVLFSVHDREMFSKLQAKADTRSVFDGKGYYYGSVDHKLGINGIFALKFASTCSLMPYNRIIH